MECEEQSGKSRGRRVSKPNQKVPCI